MITDDQIEAALNYIRDKAEDLADARAKAKFLDHKRKVIRASYFTEASGTVAERESFAETRDEYKQCIEEYREAVHQDVLISTRIKAAELKIEVWRTLNANNRRGNI